MATVMSPSGLCADLGVLLLASSPVAVVMHRPWQITDEQEKQVEQPQFPKGPTLTGWAA